MKNFITVFILLFSFAVANAQCPCCRTTPGANVYSQNVPCPAGQQGAIVILWLCSYTGGTMPTATCAEGTVDCNPNFGLTMGQFLGTSNSCFLPIELSKFVGDVAEESIALTWETKTETNSDFFALERSFDGINFREIEVIAAAGESTSDKTYSYTDTGVKANAASNAVYYRLRQVDFGGDFEYSPVIMFRIDDMFTKFEILKVTPTAQQMTINFFLGMETEVTAVVHDMQGKVVYNGTISSSMGANEASIKLNEVLSSGIYVVSLVSGDEIATQKVLIP